MLKSVLAAVVAAAFVTAVPLAAAQAQSTQTQSTAKPKTETKTTTKKLTPQQQKMKDCSAKWQDEKKAKKVSGKTAHNKFMSTCLKG